MDARSTRMAPHHVRLRGSGPGRTGDSIARRARLNTPLAHVWRTRSGMRSCFSPCERRTTERPNRSKGGKVQMSDWLLLAHESGDGHGPGARGSRRHTPDRTPERNGGVRRAKARFLSRLQNAVLRRVTSPEHSSEERS